MAIVVKSKTLTSIEFVHNADGALIDLIAHTRTDIGDDADLENGSPRSKTTYNEQTSVWAALSPTQRLAAATFAARVRQAVSA